MKFIKKDTKQKYKLKDYFEYNRKKSISITRIVSMVLFGLIIFNIFSSIQEIKDMQSYILGNSDSQSILTNSKKEVEKTEIKTDKKINIGNVRKIFETTGIENIDSIYIDQNSTNIVGRTTDIKTIEKLMKNKLLKGTYVKRIEGRDVYKFEINSGDVF